MAALPGGTDVAITHKFVSGKADGPDPTLVQPSKWNQDENLGAGADGQKIARDSGQADGGSWVNYDSASYTNNTAAGAAVGDVVAVSVAADNAVVLDDTVSSLKKFVVALQTPANAAVGAYAYMGPVPGVKAQGAIAAGQYVRKSATTKALEDAGVAIGSATTPPSGAIGFATSAAAAGFVNIYLFPSTVATAAVVLIGMPMVRGANGRTNSGTPTTQYDLVSDYIQTRNPSTGAVQLFVSPASKTVDITTAGPAVLGRDQAGAFSANSDVHLYYISKDDGTLSAIASAVAPNTGPTFPAGYTGWAYYGSYRLNGATNFIANRTKDSDVWYEGRQNVVADGQATAETTVSVSGFVPAAASEFTVHVTGANRGDNGQNFKLRYITAVDWEILSNTIAVTSMGRWTVRFPNVSQQFFYIFGAAPSATNGIYADVTGYRVKNGG